MNHNLPPVKKEKPAPEISLESTAYVRAQIPALAEPQIALTGRSNVGKSSLLNSLAGRKNLAKVSATPGKTRSINFFRVMPWNFFLTDLPGYGYARASHQERAKWGELLEFYLSGTKTLQALALLLDCRLPPQKNDLDLINYALGLRLPVLPVLTKADKCNRQERESRQRQWGELIGHIPLLTSSAKRMGIGELWERLIALGTDSKNP
ncbi:MAG: ribosome biogenesis GTP-binding protein YihA/YsxC [Desulfovibrio sp.]|jgi:GTP-binding protein|nr:ribosome biogenesis GTP-binding protein YihA/YsxC [Desulfovibrio sp.]